MTLRSKIVNTVPGNNWVLSGSFFGATILSVDRSGHGHDEEPLVFPSSPVNTGFQHSGARIVFDPNIPFAPGEIVNVLYLEP